VIKVEVGSAGVSAGDVGFDASGQLKNMTEPGAFSIGFVTQAWSDGDYAEVFCNPRTLGAGYWVVLNGSITAATTTTGGDAISLANPFGRTVIIVDVVLDVTTPATGAATMNVGVAANGTTTSDTLIDGVDVGTAAIIADNIDDAGTNGGRGVSWTS
jgi:hypothetical protein